MDQPSEILQTVQLFGGAAEIALPSRFTDVSNVRPVPDNQEVERHTGFVFSDALRDTVPPLLRVRRDAGVH